MTRDLLRSSPLSSCFHTCSRHASSSVRTRVSGHRKRVFRCESWRLKQRHLSTTDPPRSPQTAPSLPASLPALSPATSPPTVPHQRCQISAEPQTPCRTGRRRARGPGTGVTLRPASPPNAPAGRQSGSSLGTAVLGRRRQCPFSQGRGAVLGCPTQPGGGPRPPPPSRARLIPPCSHVLLPVARRRRGSAPA